jgi:hypothetical protein
MGGPTLLKFFFLIFTPRGGCFLWGSYGCVWQCCFVLGGEDLKWGGIPPWDGMGSSRRVCRSGGV